MKNVVFSDAENLEKEDLDKISLIAREMAENQAGGAIGYPNHYANFIVKELSAGDIQVSEGQLWQRGQVYDLDEPVNLDLLSHLPTVSGDTRYVAVLVRGRSETIQAEREIEVDVETEETVQQFIPKVEQLTCHFVILQGDASPSPIRPVVPAEDCAICFVLLGTAGILHTESANDYRVKTLYEVENRVQLLEQQMIIAFQRTLSLETDMTHVQAMFDNYARLDVVRQLQQGQARLMRESGIPDTARAHFYDPGLVPWAWARGHATWDARVDEGIRFPYAASEDVRLNVQNPAQDGIRIQDGLLMLDWVETNRITVQGTGSTKNISQETHTVVTPVLRHMTRSSISYGPTVAVCGNTEEYSGFDAAASGQTFQKGGETFQKVAVINDQFSGNDVNLDDFNATHTGTYDVDTVKLHNSQVAQTGNREIFAARSVQVNTWSEPYWDYVTTTEGVSGSVYAQTWQHSQPLILTSIEVNFDKVGASGNVTMLLCEVSQTGEPLFDAVIARSTVNQENLSVGWVKFEFTPRYLPPGKRYAWAVVTTGNHVLKTVFGSTYTQGTLFWSTDFAWAQGAPEEDFWFKINCTSHLTNRAQIVFDSLSLPGGMTQIKLLYESWSPGSTSMMWEIRTDGSQDWQPIQPEIDGRPNPLRGLPEACHLRLTMIGSEGLSAAIALNDNARGETHRHEFSARGITKNILFDLSTTSLYAVWHLDQFNKDLHTVAPKVLVGGTEYDADTVDQAVDIQNPNRWIVKAEFTVPTTTAGQSILDMTTSDIESVPFVERAWFSAD